jgi:hypothetical protein
MNIKQLFSYPQTAVMNNGAQDEKSEKKTFSLKKVSHSVESLLEIVSV